jgi:hypothetical protein
LVHKVQQRGRVIDEHIGHRLAVRARQGHAGYKLGVRFCQTCGASEPPRPSGSRSKMAGRSRRKGNSRAAMRR